MFNDIMQRLTELERRLSNIVSYGMVVEVDYDKALCKVKIGGNKTDWLHWAVIRAGGDRDWRPPEEGEQVTVLSPSGDLAQGLVVFSIYQQIASAPANSKDITRTKFGDGMVIDHDRAKKLTRISGYDSAGTVLVEAKNLILRTGEGGYFQTDNNGRCTRMTHMGGNVFKSETWMDITVVNGEPDHGFTEGKVLTPEEEA